MILFLIFCKDGNIIGGRRSRMVNVLFAGVSGIGKTKLAEEICSILEFYHIKVSNIIQEFSFKKFGISNVDEIKTLSKRQLEEIHKDAKMHIQKLIKTQPNVIMDDHLFVRYDKKSVKAPPNSYFKDFKIAIIVLLKDSSSNILKRKINDKKRNREIISIKQIQHEQVFMESNLKLFSKKNQIPIYCFNINEFNRLLSFFKKLTEIEKLNE